MLDDIRERVLEHISVSSISGLYTWAHTHMHVHTYTHTHTHTCKYTQINTSMHARTHTHAHTIYLTCCSPL